MSILKSDEIPSDDSLAKRQAWFGAIPLNELVYGVPISPL
jgi:hypothetical protein